MWVVITEPGEVLGPYHEERDCLAIMEANIMYGIENVHYFTTLQDALCFQKVQSFKLYQNSVDVYKELVMLA